MEVHVNSTIELAVTKDERIKQTLFHDSIIESSSFHENTIELAPLLHSLFK